MKDQPNSEQAEFWTDGSGRDWVTFETQFDALFANVTAALIKYAAPKPTDHILDIGCGTGATTRGFARYAAHVHGIDISAPMLEQARKTAPENTTFAHADAQTQVLPQNLYDGLISRFGVMFFSDPVAAFANLRPSLKPGGNLIFASWAPFKQNPWFTIPRFIAVDLLGSPPPFDPHDPGPFVFAQTDYTLNILSDAGFAAPSSRTVEIPLSLPGDAAHAAKLAVATGPAQSVIREQGGEQADREKIMSETRKKFEAFEANGAVTVPAKIHIYTAQNQS